MTTRIFMPSSFLRRTAVTLIATSVAASLIACGNEPTRAAPVNVDSVVWRLRSNPHGAVVLAQGDSLQLDVHAINIDQNPVPIESSLITYATTNKSYVTVSPTGLIRAVLTTPPLTRITIVATYKADNAVRSDTTIVAVTSTRLAVDSISFVPDSTRIAFWYLFYPKPMAWGRGAQLPDVYIGVTVRDPSASANIVQGYATFNVPGEQWVYASTNAYGHAYSDSLRVFVIGWPSQTFSLFDQAGGGISLNSGLGGQTIQPCGTIVWSNQSSASLNITFDEPEQTGTCGADDQTPTGNVVNFAKNTTVIRKFPHAGRVKWTASHTSAPGAALLSSIIIVK